VNSLLKVGKADPNIVSGSGTCLELAESLNQHEIADCIRRYLGQEIPPRPAKVSVTKGLVKTPTMPLSQSVTHPNNNNKETETTVYGDEKGSHEDKEKKNRCS